jgi:hypothetical protein
MIPNIIMTVIAAEKDRFRLPANLMPPFFKFNQYDRSHNFTTVKGFELFNKSV